MSATKGFTASWCSLIVVGDEVIAQARARGDKEQDIARMERRVQDLRHHTRLPPPSWPRRSAPYRPATS